MEEIKSEEFNTEENKAEEIKEIKQQKPITLFILVIILFLMIGVLFYFQFVKEPKTAQTETIVKSQAEGITIAYVNSDTLMDKYQFVLDELEKLKKLEASYTNSLQRDESKLKTDYQNYMQTGASKTMSQQKAIEEDLKKREQQLYEKTQSLTEKFQKNQVEINKMIKDSIDSYIRRYNKEAGFTYILDYGTLTSIIYADSSLDITSYILEGLNKEYEASHNTDDEKED